MSRVDEIRSFIEFDSKEHHIIEPEYRREQITERLNDIIKTYNPGVIVKIGLGNENLLFDLLDSSKSYLVVVEPSEEVVKNFLKTHENRQGIERCQFIIGQYEDFPVDYYKADMVVCIDYFDFLDTSKALDEFKRALEFDGILFFGGVVLSNDDIDGIYDELMHRIYPVHNDYYLEDDLKTFFTLKEFDLVKSHVIPFDMDIESEVAYMKDYYPDMDAGAVNTFIEENRDIFQNYYNLHDNTKMRQYYMIAAFMRLKPDTGSKI